MKDKTTTGAQKDFFATYRECSLPSIHKVAAGYPRGVHCAGRYTR